MQLLTANTKALQKYPAVSRDLSMVVPKHVLAGDIEKVFDERGGKILESYELFDIYEAHRLKQDSISGL